MTNPSNEALQEKEISAGNIDIPNDCTEIVNDAYKDREDIKSVCIPSSVTIIGDYAFSNCKNLESITIPNSVTTIGEGAFDGCEKLKDVHIPDGVTKIGKYLFYNCKNLTVINIPAVVTKIGKCAFYHCESLKDINLPNGVTKIGKYAFDDCDNLTVHCSENSYAYAYCQENDIDVKTPKPKNKPVKKEQKLYRRTVSYITALPQTTGTLLITNNKISYKPAAVFFLSKEIKISMNEVLRAEKGNIAGLGINVFTKSGKKYYFSFGINSDEVKKAVDLINRYKKNPDKSEFIV